MRSDPFFMGMAAHRGHFLRLDCPFPRAHVEARQWLAGFDHAAFRAREALAEPQPDSLRSAAATPI
mgnify:CR=1 FL=1